MTETNQRIFLLQERAVNWKSYTLRLSRYTAKPKNFFCQIGKTTGIEAFLFQGEWTLHDLLGMRVGMKNSSHEGSSTRVSKVSPRLQRAQLWQKLALTIVDEAHMRNCKFSICLILFPRILDAVKAANIVLHWKNNSWICWKQPAVTSCASLSSMGTKKCRDRTLSSLIEILSPRIRFYALQSHRLSSHEGAIEAFPGPCMNGLSYTVIGPIPLLEIAQRFNFWAFRARMVSFFCATDVPQYFLKLKIGAPIIAIRHILHRRIRNGVIFFFVKWYERLILYLSLR